MSLGLFGESFWYTVERDDLGYPTCMEVLHPSFMKVETDDFGRRVYEYGMPNNWHVLDPDDVTHITRMAMPGAVRGLSGIEYGQVIFAIALAAYEYGSRWFAQGASPGYILTTKGKLNPSELQRIAEKFLFEHGGLANSHLPLIVDNGMEVSKIQSTPDESQYMQTLEFARSAIFDWFGIPLFLRNNALERNTPEPPGTISERSTAFLRFTLAGYIVPLQQGFSGILEDDLYAAFDTSEFTRADVKSLAAEIMNLRNTQVASVNDIRVRKLGWEPSEEDDADKVLLPLASNVAPSQTQNAPTSSEPAEPEPDDENSGRPPMTLRDATASLSDAATALARIAQADAARSEDKAKMLVNAATKALSEAEMRRDESDRRFETLASILKEYGATTAEFVAYLAERSEQDDTTVNKLAEIASAMRDAPPPVVNVDIEAPEIHLDPVIDVKPSDVLVVPATKRSSKVIRNNQGAIIGLEDQ